MAILLALCGVFAAPMETTIDAGVLARRIVVQDGRLVSTRFSSPVAKSELNLTDAGDFALILMDGRTLTAGDYRVENVEQGVADGAKQWLFRLTPRKSGDPLVVMEHRAKPGEHFLRKRLLVEGSVPIDRLVVEQLGLQEQVKLGGFGQPLYVADRWFFGLEHPAGEQEYSRSRMTCSHSPGREKVVSPWCVVGVVEGKTRRIEDEFQRYLQSIRRPLRSSLQFNTWFDRRDAQVEPATLQRTFDQLSENLLKPHGLPLDAFVLDDGYQDSDLPWRANASWKGGLTPFAGWLQQRQSRLGLWLPLNGYRTNLDAGARMGWERSNHPKRCFCLAAPRYDAAVREMLGQMMKQARPAALKHDFNFLTCSADGHAHLPTSRHGREANVDAELALLALERELAPDAFVAVTSGVWPSPWWLMHCDAIWMGGSDYRVDGGIPHWNSREAETTFRDDRLHRLCCIDRAEVPLSALMTHGIIRGRHEGTAEPEDLDTWSDYVVWHLGRGTLLHELYLSPELIPADHWNALGRALQWAKANLETLSQTAMIGGGPSKGETYGFSHWSTDKGIVCFRNPSPTPAKVVLSAANRPKHLPIQSRWRPVVVYPYREMLGSMDADQTLDLSMPAGSILVVELYARLPASLSSLEPGRFELLASKDGARLIHYAPASSDHIQKLTLPLSGGKESTSEVHFDPGDDDSTLTLQVLREPAGGAVVAAHSQHSLQPVQWRSHHGPTGWDLTRWNLDSRKSAVVRVAASLPPSPFWPQNATICAVLRSERPLAKLTETALPAGVETPKWPASTLAAVAVEETVLMDRVALHRRRSAIESASWVVALAVLPAMIVLGVSSRITRGRSLLWRRGVLLAGVSTLLLLYLITPLGPALARSFQ